MSAATTTRLSARLLVRFPDAASANARLGGMAAAARWAARARSAGFGEVTALVPGATNWPIATADDFGRTGIAATLAAPGDEGGTIADGRYLLDEATLQALAGRRIASATYRGVTIVSSERLGATLALDETQVADLAQPDLALRHILLATAKPTDGIVSRSLNRPVSQRISALLLRYYPAILPSHATGVVALVAMAMLACLLFGGAAGLVAGGVLFHVASVLDGVDGEIARASYRGSQAGAVLDTRVDMLTNIGFFVGIAVALTRLYGGTQAVVGGLAVLFALTGLALLAWLVRRSGSTGSFDVLKPYYRARFPGGWQWLVTETLVATTSRDFFAFALGVVILAGAGWAVSWLLMGFAAIWLLTVLCAVPGVLRQAQLGHALPVVEPVAEPVVVRGISA